MGTGFLLSQLICICKNKAPDQLCSNCTADQRLCVCFSDSKIPLLRKLNFSLQPDEEEQVVFYDAVEDTEQLSSEDEMPSMLLTDPRLRLLRDKMAGIHRRRAKLRTKKVA